MSLPKSIFLLDGKEIESPIQRQDISIKLTFDNEIQPSIELQNFTFVKEAIEIIDEHFENGGAFEGLSFQILLRNHLQELQWRPSHGHAYPRRLTMNEVRMVPRHGMQIMRFF